MSDFTFSFSGDDIDKDPSEEDGSHSNASPSKPEGTRRVRRNTGPAFPIAGKETLAPQAHSFSSMMDDLPSKIAFKCLHILCDDGSTIIIPRRELWDVRMQLMAEEDDENLGNLGQSDIKTGLYEGGFKSWESSSDLVKVLHHRRISNKKCMTTILELGCGTALPTLYEFQKHIKRAQASAEVGELTLALADYNPTVLQLVTLPNIILSWAQEHFGANFGDEGELGIDENLIQEFTRTLQLYKVKFSFFSGGWNSEFVDLLDESINIDPDYLIIIGAETIYSASALRTFAGVVLDALKLSNALQKVALVAAKTFYFGVGGTMSDFMTFVRQHGGKVKTIREETRGVARAVIEVKLPLEDE